MIFNIFGWLKMSGIDISINVVSFCFKIIYLIGFNLFRNFYFLFFLNVDRRMNVVVVIDLFIYFLWLM